MIYRTPEIMRLSIDPDEHLVQVPAPLRKRPMMKASLPDRPVLEAVDGPVEMPDLVVEVGVAESANQGHEAIEVCAVGSSGNHARTVYSCGAVSR